MKIKTIIGVASVFISCLCLPSCNASKKVTTVSENSETATRLSPDKQQEFDYLFIEGIKQKLLGKPNTAVQLFSSCLQIDQNSAATMFELAGIHVANGDLTSGMLLLEKAIKINPENEYYKLMLAQIYSKNNNLNKAIELYAQLVEANPDNLDYKFAGASLMANAHRFDEALKVYDEIEQESGLVEAVAMAKYQIYLQKGKKKQAVAEIHRLIDAFPEMPNYYGVLADYYSEEGNKEEALKYYNKILELEPDNGVVHFSLARFYRENDEPEKEFDEILAGFSSKKSDFEIKVQIYLLLTDPEAKKKLPDEQNEKLLDLLTDIHSIDGRSWALAGEYYLQKQKKEIAEDKFRKAVEVSPEDYFFWERLLLVENDLHKFDTLYSDSQKTIENFPSQPLPYLLNSVASIQLKNYQEAIDALNRGEAYALDNKPVKSQFYLYRAEAYYKMDKTKEAFHQFEKVIEMDPENYVAMNNYAYYLSVRGEQLDKAERLSSKAIQAHPNNPTYLDTYAWVLFKKKDYQLAKFYMKTALDNDLKGEPTLLEHYGDILFHLGDHEEALEYWKKSLEKGNESELIKLKIKTKKYFKE